MTSDRASAREWAARYRAKNLARGLTSRGRPRSVNQHRLRDGVCAICGPVTPTPRWGAPGRAGKVMCPASFLAQRLRDNSPGRRYRYVKDDHCHVCGFVALHPGQLDVDHRDENHDNNDPSNLWTLCANCHRLKTQYVRGRVHPALVPPEIRVLPMRG